MALCKERVVRRIQRRLLARGPVGRSWRPAPHERAELASRIDRLRAVSDRFRHVGLSRYVLRDAPTNVPACVGGECVTTEV